MVPNADVASLFAQIADLLEIRGDNPFRVRAYRNAARTVEEWPQSLSEILSRTGSLPRMPGIGADLDGKIREILTTGHLSTLDKLREAFPPHLTDLLEIPGLGPRKVKTFYEELGIHDVAGLSRALRDHRIAALPGFGAKSEERIAKSVASRLAKVRRYRLADAARQALPLLDALRSVRGVRDAVVAGSFRRMRETVGDLDFLVTSEDPGPVVERLVGYGEVDRVLASGPTKASVVLRTGLQVDLRVLPQISFGAALVYFTGSKPHNIALRRLAQEKGLKINEYGVFRGKERIAGSSEESVYRALGLAPIPPELREDRGEIQAAARGPLPELVALSDLRGDLHARAPGTGVINGVAGLARAARDRGFAYLAISGSGGKPSGRGRPDPDRLLAKKKDLDPIQARIPDVALLLALEVEIRADGSLGLPDEALSDFDLVVGAVEDHFDLSREAQTARVLRALEHPRLNILAHPTGRLLGEREPADLDMLRILRKAREHQVALEIDARPDRLDLPDLYCRMARDEGVLLAPSALAKNPEDFENLAFGVGQARRGWTTKKDVLTTRPLEEVRRFLEKRT
jgi:DNA polymerase (family 10)